MMVDSTKDVLYPPSMNDICTSIHPFQPFEEGRMENRICIPANNSNYRLVGVPPLPTPYTLVTQIDAGSIGDDTSNADHSRWGQ